MITPKPIPWQSDAWTRELAMAVTDLDTLLAMLQLERIDLSVDDRPDFNLRVPRPFIARMQPGNPADPLLLQVLPLAAEREFRPGHVPDPLRESEATRGAGLIQKYAGRALLIAAPSCAVHCRYCFRRHFPYDDQYAGQALPGIDVIADDPSVREVILSGGDPLMLKDAALAKLVSRLEELPHVERLRIHTRLPVVIPARVTHELAALLVGSRLLTSLVLHVNHPQEIDADLRRALRLLKQRGVTLLNQSVLLRAVNADADTLIRLSEDLFACGVLPYYLHLPDPVAGTGHFHVSAAEGRALLAALAATLPGYLVPKLAREVPGAAAKLVFANL
jgi:EF-P beta-lysylation protein EpmB